MLMMAVYLINPACVFLNQTCSQASRKDQFPGRLLCPVSGSSCIGIEFRFQDHSSIRICWAIAACGAPLRVCDMEVTIREFAFFVA